jgi:hypothetical protein
MYAALGTKELLREVVQISHRFAFAQQCAAKDVAGFRFHRVPALGGADAQARFQRVVNVPDRQASHALLSCLHCNHCSFCKTDGQIASALRVHLVWLV